MEELGGLEFRGQHAENPRGSYHRNAENAYNDCQYEFRDTHLGGDSWDKHQEAGTEYTPPRDMERRPNQDHSILPVDSYHSYTYSGCSEIYPGSTVWVLESVCQGSKPSITTYYQNMELLCYSDFVSVSENGASTHSYCIEAIS